jgi:hypothetical protein
MKGHDMDNEEKVTRLQEEWTVILLGFLVPINEALTKMKEISSHPQKIRYAFFCTKFHRMIKQDVLAVTQALQTQNVRIIVLCLQSLNETLKNNLSPFLEMLYAMDDKLREEYLPYFHDTRINEVLTGAQMLQLTTDALDEELGDYL